MLPKRPFLPSLGGYRQPEVKDLAARLSAWGTGVNGVLDALPNELALARAHATRHIPGGADALATATAGASTPGDSAAEGSAKSFARSDHRHSLPPFGRAAGEFAEGDDLDGIDDRVTDLENVSPIITQWTPDAPPIGSVHAKTDEFDSGSAWDGKWSEFDQSTELTPSVANGFGWLTVADQGANNRNVAMYQTVPAATDYAVACKLHLSQPGGVAGFLQAGLFLSQDLGSVPTTADWEVVRTNQGNTLSIDQAGVTAYNGTYAAAANTTVSRTDRDVYFRIRVTGTTTVAWDWSSEGIGWHQLRSFTVGFTPVHMGVYVRNRSGGEAYVRVQWFRVAEATAALSDLVPGGRVLNVYA